MIDNTILPSGIMGSRATCPHVCLSVSNSCKVCGNRSGIQVILAIDWDAPLTKLAPESGSGRRGSETEQNVEQVEDKGEESGAFF